jgi:hypothetical protein
MENVTKQNWKEMPKSKKFFILSGALFLLAIVLTILKSLLFGLSSTAPHMGGVSGDFGVQSVSLELPSFRAKSVSNNIAMDEVMSPVEDGYSVGSDSENYETLSYQVNFKKSNIDSVCGNIKSLKNFDYVVFERSRNNETSCSFSFKVKRDKAEEVISYLNSLNPVSLTANTEVVKKQVVEYDSRLQILLKRQDELKKTLDDAIVAYDNLVLLATKVENPDSLTKVINSKLATIEKLTNQRFSLSQQIDTLSRRSAELNDRIEYAYFNVNVTKYRVFNLASIKDSWVNQTRSFVYGVNEMLQSLTLGVLRLFLVLLQSVVYISIIGFVIVAFSKFSWRFVKTFWSK